jgi:hypothetical protein
MKNFILTVILLAISFLNNAGQDIGGDFYVATWGSDLNVGTYDKPWETWQKAFESAQPGDTVYFRGGVWYPTEYADGNAITVIAPNTSFI